MGLDYKYTCPRIDGNIADIKTEIENYLSDLIPTVPSDIISSFAAELYGNIESNIEDMRKSNEEMREAADKQIDELTEDLQARIDELERDLEDSLARVKELDDLADEQYEEIEKLKEQLL